MALVLADRVRETTTVTGTGTATLLGAAPGYQSFSAVGNANTTYYVIANQSATEWEVGIGTYTASGTLLSRDTVLSSSNSGSLVNFSAGTKDVFVDYPASKAVYEDAAGNVDGYPITGGTINNTTIGATTPSTGVFTTLTGNSTSQFGRSSTNYVQIVGAATTVAPNISAQGGDTNIPLRLSSKNDATIYGVTNGVISFDTYAPSGSVNYLRLRGNASGTGAALESFGSDANVDIILSAKGTGAVRSYTNGNQQLAVTNTASAVNYVQVTGGATTKGVIQSAQGSDSNISYVTQSKGTGAIDLAAGSSGVNISNGGTVTAITRTAGGSAYATAPTVAISAPTTAGGVQATATVAVSAGAITTFTITNAGSGYVEQPTVTFSGGGGSGAAAYATVGSGTLVQSIGSTMSFRTPSGEALRLFDAGGTGVNYLGVQGRSAGNGPLITAQGSDTNIFLGVSSKGTSQIGFYTNNVAQEQLRVSHTASAVNYVQVTGAATGGAVNLSAQGSDTNIQLRFVSKGNQGISFFCRGGSAQQFSITSTNNAVNHLQATGAVASSSPILETAGTDTNIDLTLAPKGTGNVRFGTYTGTALSIAGFIEIKTSDGVVRKLAVVA